MLESELVKSLQCFNRKERYWLIRTALGDQNLSRKFREDLTEAFRLQNQEVVIPQYAWWAVDFHVDWLFGALSKLNSADSAGTVFPNNDFQIKGTQEDFDMVIAFDQTLIVLEAKAGEAWNKGQMDKKMKRLELLAAFNDKLAQPLKLYFAITSPNETQELTNSGSLPLSASGSKLPWTKLEFGLSNVDLLAVERCDKRGKPDAKGGHWKVRPYRKAPL